MAPGRAHAGGMEPGICPHHIIYQAERAVVRAPADLRRVAFQDPGGHAEVVASDRSAVTISLALAPPCLGPGCPFMVEHSRDRNSWSAKVMVTSLRTFPRFAHGAGPTAVRWPGWSRQ